MFDGPTTADNISEMISSQKPALLDFRFTDVSGRWGHLCRWAETFPSSAKPPLVALASSHLVGWGDSAQSEVALRPILDTAFMDPFSRQRTLILNCHIVDPVTETMSDKDSRATLERACAYLNATGIADTLMVGAELEFYLFDEVQFRQSSNECFVRVSESDGVDSVAAASVSGSSGHRISYAAHQYSVGPADGENDFRAGLLKTLSEIGAKPLHHHHEAGPCQHEVTLQHATAVTAADRIQASKYAVLSSASRVGKSATFMPKPLAYKPGSGLHINLSLWKSGVSLFPGARSAGLSEIGASFLAGIIDHARALTAFLNPSINSFKRLDAISNPMAPVLYGTSNRTTPIRVPRTSADHEKRIEVRFGDAVANPYLAIAAVLLAGLDGVERGLTLGTPHEGDVHKIGGAFDPRRRSPKSLCRSLEEAVVSLHEDAGFLFKAGTFSSPLVDAHTAELCRQIRVCRSLPHPNEFLMSYGS